MLADKLRAAAAYAAAAGGWNLADASFNGGDFGRFRVSSQETTPHGIFFKPDGTKMYIIGSSGDDVNEYNLSTAWDILTASFLQNFSVLAQESVPTAIFFKPDGTKMYIIGRSGDDVNEYDLSVAWNVTTASFLQNFSVSAQESNPEGSFFKPDGTKMYIIGRSGDDVNEYDLSVAWNVTTASFLQNFSVSAQESTPTGIFFKPEGTKMYIVGSIGDDVNEYDLSVAWDISTASFLQNFSVASQDTSPEDIFFKPDGTKMYIVGAFNDSVYGYDLSIAWDISTAAFITPADYFSVSNPEGIFFKPDGTKMYILLSTTVNEYDLSTAWAISTASFLQNFSVQFQDTLPQGIFFKPDGTKMYMIGAASDRVNEYDLSVAWNVTTASFLQNFSVSPEDSNPDGIFFKPDGTKMYMVGSTGDDVNEYDLSIAWDISTASFLQNFSVQFQDTLPQGIFFKPDGTKMYMIGAANFRVNEYDLSTAWDISTASFLYQNFSVQFQDTSPQDIFFKPDGTKMYIAGVSSDAIWAYDL